MVLDSIMGLFNTNPASGSYCRSEYLKYGSCDLEHVTSQVNAWVLSCLDSFQSMRGGLFLVVHTTIHLTGQSVWCFTARISASFSDVDGCFRWSRLSVVVGLFSLFEVKLHYLWFLAIIAFQFAILFILE